MAVNVRGVAALQHELEKAKENLKDVDDNIKKLTGRTPGELRPGGPLGQRRLSAGGRGDDGGRGRLFSLARRSIEESGGGGGLGAPPAAKRRIVGGAFSRLGPRVNRGIMPQGGPDSGDEEELPHKPVVQSSVIATAQDTRTRQDKIREEGKNKEGKDRNKRMFGLLLGTLSKFQAESKVKKEKDEQRQAIEQKLEERARAEKDEIRKERQGLFQERKKQQLKLKRLEHKMELVQSHDEWEAQTRTLMNFIRTKGKPHLFYLPKTHTANTEKKLAETGAVLEGIISDRRKQLEEEIEDLMNRDDDAEHKPTGDKEENGGGQEGDDAPDESMDVSREEEMTSPNKDQKAERRKSKSSDRGGSRDRRTIQTDRRRSPNNQMDRDRRGGAGRKSPDKRRSSRDVRRRSESTRSRERSRDEGRKRGARDRTRSQDDKENRIRDRRRDRSKGKERDRSRSRDRTGTKVEHKPLGLEQEEGGAQSDRESTERAIKKEKEDEVSATVDKESQDTETTASQPAQEESEKRVDTDGAVEKNQSSPRREVVKRKGDEEEESGKDGDAKDAIPQKKLKKKQKKQKHKEGKEGDEDRKKKEKRKDSESGTEDSSSSSSSSSGSSSDSENSEAEETRKKKDDSSTIKNGETDNRRVVVEEEGMNE